MDQAAACDSTRWIGWRGYLYLYFYRDYARLLQILTPPIPLRQILSMPLKDIRLTFGGSCLFRRKELRGIHLLLSKTHCPCTENKRIDSMPHYLEKAQHYYLDKSADTKYYYALYHARKGYTLKALSYLDKGIEDFLGGTTNEEITMKKSGRSMSKN